MDTNTVSAALSVLGDKNPIPFAIDSFGNYICYHVETGTIAFWDHETSHVISTDKNLAEFLDSLY